MILIHERTDQRNDYHYYRTDRSVTVQIGRSVNAGQYVWSVYHPEIRCAIWGGESPSLEMAEKEASEWVLQWVSSTKA
ncbi:MAG: hypothetical protein FWC42_09710 [Proteobacteria bacterium]|nr:hypothetical protein [Pseudomonadota bacterium]